MSARTPFTPSQITSTCFRISNKNKRNRIKLKFTSVTQVVDLSTGSRRDDVTASVGEMFVSRSGRFVVIVDYDRQHAVSVHCLDGLLRQLAEEDIAAGVKHRCPAYINVDKHTAPPQSNSFDCNTCLSGVPSQPESETTLDEFIQRCKRPPPPPVCIASLVTSYNHPSLAARSKLYPTS